MNQADPCQDIVGFVLGGLLPGYVNLEIHVTGLVRNCCLPEVHSLQDYLKMVENALSTGNSIWKVGGLFLFLLPLLLLVGFPNSSVGKESCLEKQET